MAGVRLESIVKRHGNHTILNGVDLVVEDGEFLVLVGPSGCGKSTLLRSLAGLEPLTSGKVFIGDRDVTNLPPRDRDVAMVFQSYALYPHLKVRENLAFGLRMRGEGDKVIAERIAEISRVLGIEPLLERFPKQLSGGQRQRVAMGRAMVRRPSVFLFDEPLSNLDASLRNEVRLEIRRLRKDLGTTTVYVTHDQTEAMTLADRIAVLNGGKVEQVGTPEEIYRKPATQFVAGFIGSPKTNFLAATRKNGAFVGPSFHMPAEKVLFREGRVLENDKGFLAIRPHDLVVTDEPQSELSLHVELVEWLGNEAYAHGHVGQQKVAIRLSPQQQAPQPGQLLHLQAMRGAPSFFNEQGDSTLT